MRRHHWPRLATALCLAWSSFAQALPAPAAAPAPTPVAASAPGCLAADAATLAKMLPRSLAQPILPTSRPLPSGDEAVVGMAGKIAMSAPGASPDFRVFVAPRVVRYNGLAEGFPERRPISVEHAAEGAPKDSYTIHFVPPRFRKQFDPLKLTQQRSVFVVACDGDRVAAWAAQPLPFSSPNVAHLWAAIFVLIVYVATGWFVYHRRISVAKQEEEDDEHKVYRIATVDRWSFLRCLDPVTMTSDVFDRGSLSKLQILFFVLLVAYSLAFLAIWRGELSDISASIVYLLGIPALGTLGSQVATTNRDRISTENWAWLVTRKVLPLNEPGSEIGPRWSDLIMSDSELDLYKLQALTFSVIVGFSMLTTGPVGLAKFEVPTTLLEILGLSQVVFVGGRLSKPTTMGDLDKLITELRARDTALHVAATTGVDVDDKGKPLAHVTSKKPAKPPTDMATAAAIAPVAARRYQDTAQQTQVLLEALAHRSVNGPRLMTYTPGY